MRLAMHLSLPLSLSISLSLSLSLSLSGQTVAYTNQPRCGVASARFCAVLQLSQNAGIILCTVRTDGVQVGTPDTKQISSPQTCPDPA
ncbi:uncharacterized protein RSE6_04955 [Rhynchosporium secalis]|uniref:Secreted protein n=1 Tax=Rhynchosporium secalis TaxID=38038 RepID=A0A1E1M6L0_RHYSE|nr:uncharacterized protein RSE6_04955 [Rhynchosporium secalis]